MMVGASSTGVSHHPFTERCTHMGFATHRSAVKSNHNTTIDRVQCPMLLCVVLKKKTVERLLRSLNCSDLSIQSIVYSFILYDPMFLARDLSVSCLLDRVHTVGGSV